MGARSVGMVKQGEDQPVEDDADLQEAAAILGGGFNGPRRRTFDELASTAEDEEVRAGQAIHARYENGAGAAGAMPRIGPEFQAKLPAPGQSQKKGKLLNSKIQGVSERREPRLGAEYQAVIPDCVGGKH